MVEKIEKPIDLLKRLYYYIRKEKRTSVHKCYGRLR